jgi:hypothetical protein
MAFIYDLTDTWNNAGTSFNGIKLNATDTASAAGSKLLDLQINGASKFTVGKTGALIATGLIESTVGGFRFPDGTTQTTKATVNSVSGTGTVNGLTLTGTVTNSGSLTLGGTLVLTSGQVTTALGYTPYNATNPSNYLSTVSLTSNVTGTLPIANGGTGATTASLARTALGLGTAATTDASAYATAAQGTKADTAVQTIASTDGSVTVTGTTTAIDLSVATAGATSNVLLPIRNTTGATLTKGTAVYISGATGQISTVSKAIANSDATSAQTLGLVTANIANNANGNVTLIGTLTNINTSAYTDGQQLYLSPTTAGTLTATKPYAPQHLVYMAVVEHAHPTQGKLFVKVQNGYEMDELHDVSAQSPSNNDGLFYNTTTGLWENKSIVTALGYTPYNATNPSGYLTSSTASTTYQPLDGDLTAIAALAGTTGIVRKTAANTYTLDTAAYLTGITSGQVTTALGYTPANKAGDTFTGNVIVNGNTTLGDAVGDLTTVPDQLALEYTTDSLPATRPALSLDFADVGALDPRVTFTRSTTATFVGSNGLIQTAAINAPRFDYDPVTLAAKGLLIEEQRTNLALQSQTFDNATWSKIGATVTANTTTAPDGTTTADTLVEDTSTGVHIAFQAGSFVAGTTYTITVFAKAGTRTRLNMINVGGVSYDGYFDLLTGTVISSPVGTASITAAGNGWYRCQMTSTAGSTSSGNVQFRLVSSGTTTSYTGDGTSGLFLWGAQLEAGAFATSYIPTVASQVTRSADVATMTGTNFSSWYNQSEGTFVADFDKYSTTLRGGVLCAGNISGLSGTGITLDGQNNGKVRAFIENAGALVMDNLTLADYTANTPIKGAIAYATNNSVGAAAGALGTVDTSVAVPTVDNFQIGAVRNTTAAAVLPLNGHIRSITYFNTRLPNAVLQGVTR